MLTVGDLRRILEGREFAPAIRRALEDLVRVYDGRRCDIFMSAAMVYWQGDVTPCRLLKVPLHPAVGSILGEAYPQIWQNESFRRFRFALQHGVVPVSCQKCPFVACA
jgi:radical SAM protein with 4Fe4S-binding SPASM domain